MTGQRDLMVCVKRPAREEQISIATLFHFDIELKQMCGRLKPLLQYSGLIVKPTATDIAIDFLQADDIGRLGFDDLLDPLEAIAAVSAADPLVDVVAQQTHRKLHSMGGLTFWKASH